MFILLYVIIREKPKKKANNEGKMALWSNYIWVENFKKIVHALWSNYIWSRSKFADSI